jgi:ATP-binding cassette subfamily B protein
MKRFPFYQQLDRMDCGPACLRMVARFYGQYYSLEELRGKSYAGRQGTSLLNLSQAAEELGFLSGAVTIDWNTLQQDVALPCIVLWKDQHFVVVHRITTRYVYVADPAIGKIRYRKKEFLAGWKGEDRGSGVALLLEPTGKFDESSSTISPKNAAWRVLISFLKPYRRYLGQLFLGIVAIGVVQAAFPFLTQALFDEGIAQSNLHFVYIILIAQLILFTSQTVGEVIRSYLLLYIGNRVSISLLTSFLQKLMQLPQPFFEKKNLGDLFQRITDNERIEEFLTAQSLSVLLSLFSVVLFGLILAYYHLTIFLVFVVGSTLYLGWVLLLGKRRRVLEYKRFKVSAQQHSQLQDLLYGMPEIQLNGSQQRRRWQWEATRIKQHQVAIKALSIDELQTRGGTFIHELKNMGITILAAILVIQGQMSIGMVVAVHYIIGQLNVPLLNLIDFFQSAQDAQISLSRLLEIHNMDNNPAQAEIEINSSASDVLGCADIRLADVSFHYEGPNSPAVLQEVNATIPYGKVTAIVGSSGSGKTTLLKLLLKSYQPTEGTIYLDDQSLERWPSSQWRSKCGAVMQDGYIFDDTILRNITESDSRRPLDKERLTHAVKIAQLEQFISSLPKGYSTPIGQNGMGLSGGQRQRLLIARAVYKDPDYLFFDEATSGLDAENERFIVNNLENFYQDRTVVIIAHRLSTVKHADQILVLHQGRVVEQGTHRELTDLRGRYYSLVKNQLELGA